MSIINRVMLTMTIFLLPAALAVADHASSNEQTDQKGDKAEQKAAKALEKKLNSIDASLRKARDRYEKSMGTMRGKVLKDLSKLQDKQRADAKNLDEIKQTVAKQNSFKATGEWPDIRKIDVKRRSNEAHRKRLNDAYELARTKYLRLRQDDSVQLIQDMAADFDEEDDVVPWGENRIVGLDEAKLEVTATETTFEIDALGNTPYRIQLTATVTEGDEPISLELPVPGSRLANVTVSPNADGVLRAMFSVRESSVSNDLGAPHAIQLEDGGKPGTIKASAAKGKYRIDSIQVKPILARNRMPEKPGNQKPRAKRQAMPRVHPAALLVKGSKWTGTQFHNGNQKPVDIKCFFRQGNDIKISTRKFNGAGHIDFWFRIKGDKLALVGIVPIGQGGMIIRRYEGGGWINGRKMGFSYRYETQVPGKPHRTGRVSEGRFEVGR